jgi:two-component system OmpR family response regulator
MTTTTILIADDDAHIREVVRYALEREGHQTVLASDGSEAIERVREGGIDLVVLDVLMPDVDGLTVCRRLRAEGRVPIVMLSSRGDVVDRVLGLELGADDYVCKPFSPRELVTRVHAVLRRAGAPPAPPAETLRHGTVTVDRARHEVRAAGRKIDLTATEFAVLETLLAQPGRLLSRAQLIRRAYSAGHHITERTIDTHVRRIRAKLRASGVDPIETVHGLGYKASDPS